MKRTLTAMAAILSLASFAHAADLASTKGAPAAPTSSLDPFGDYGPLTWNGITLFGTIDVGGGWASHAAPINSDLYFGNVAVAKMNNHAMTNVVPSGLSQTGVGIKASHELFGDVSGVVMASTGINPQSFHLANAPGSLADNNGIALANQSLNADGTRGGQAFNDELYAGLSSKMLGQITFGRQKSISNETMAAYDPAGYSYNYSIIGLSGTPVAGGGVTDDGRLDNALKYKVTVGPVRFGALYKFADRSAGMCGAIACADHNDAVQANLGASLGALNLDVVGGHFNQAVTYSALATGVFTPVDTLAAKAYDTSDVMVGANYTWNQFKFFAGYAWDLYHNAKDPIGVGADSGQGGYWASTVTVPALSVGQQAKVLQTVWTGVKYSYDPKTEITLSYYHEGQNNYTGSISADAKTCSNAIQSSRKSDCAGAEHFVSLYADYHVTKHLDVYGGLTFSAVTGGMSNGFTYASTDWAPTAGVRYKF